LEEVFVDAGDFGEGKEAGRRCLKAALEARFRAVDWIAKPEGYEWIVYLDADCLSLRSLEHLFSGDADLLVQPERGRSLTGDAVFNGYVEEAEPRSRKNGWLGRDGINAGTFAVRGHRYREVMEEWRRIHASEPPRHLEFRDQTAFNRLLLDTDLRVRPFERGEIMFPFHLDKGFLDYREAALLHFVGGGQKEKIDLAFALHMMRTYGDESGLFLDLMES
jgi:lipopolysaccharide biosynthesis glycosyltransferase